MVDALRELGCTIDESVLRARSEQGKAIGRPHLAQAVVSHPDNADRLEREGLTDPSAFLVAYLIEGRPAFQPRLGPSVAEAIELIHGAGGVAVWAHPFWDVASPAEVLSTLDRFVGLGLDGVEAFYVTHTRAQTEMLVDRCCRARPAHHRFIGLPRAPPPRVQALPRVRDLRADRQPRADSGVAESRAGV